MKWLIVILVALFSLSFNGNHSITGSPLKKDTVPTGAAPQLFGSKLYEFRNYVVIDSILMVMAGDTFDIPRWPGLKYKTSDNRWYGYHGTRWRAFLNGLDTISLSNRINAIGITLNNVGSGFRYVTTPFGSIKTNTSSNTIIWDSTSNANALTAKVDTSVIATQYDLTQISASPGGSNTQVQFNDAGAFGGDAGFTFNKTSNTITTDSFRVKNIRINENPYNADSIRFHGTSITIGVGQTAAGRYANITSQRLNALESNYGISGATLVTQGWANISTLPVFDRAKYRWIVLEWGVNDIQLGGDSTTFDTTYRKYIDTLTIARGWPASRIVILAPSYIDPSLGSATLLRQAQFRSCTQAIATAKGCKWVDIYSLELFRNPLQNILYDQIHPNDYGAAIYAAGIAKATGDSVMSTNQNISGNGTYELQRLKLRTVDTADYNSMPAGFDGYGNFVRFTKDQLIQNSTTLPYPQGASISLTGTGMFGNVASPNAVDKVQVNGSIQGDGIRAIGNEPSGFVGESVNMYYASGTGYIYARAMPSNVAKPINIAPFGGGVRINSMSASGGDDKLYVDGGVRVGYGHFTGALGSLTGAGVEIGNVSGSGYIGAYSRPSGGALPLTIQLLGGNTMFGTNTDNTVGKVQIAGKITVSTHTIAANYDSALVWDRSTNEYKVAKINGATATTIYNGDGSLSGNRAITGAGNTLTLTGTQASAAAFNVSNTGNGEAVSAVTTGSGSALSVANSGSGTGATLSSNTGTAVNTTSTSGTLFRGIVNPSSTNTEVVTLRTIRQSSGTPAAGMGQIYSMDLEDDNLNNITAVQQKAVWTSAASGATSADYQLWNINAGTFGQKFTVKSTGQVQLNVGYGSVSFSGTPVSSIQSDVNGNLINGPLLAAGTYTPTLTNGTNVAASTAYACQYMRVGNTVTVSGKVDIDPTAAAATVLGISLPIASALANDFQLAGTLSAGIESYAGSLKGDATNDRAQVDFVIPVTGSTANTSWFFSFTYLIL